MQTRHFMYRIIKELGVPSQEIELFLGDNPSYFAQMEVLTRLMFQSPEFYTGLYTSPANVKCMGVALEAVKIMQNRDRYEAALRREMLTSMILEMHNRENQGVVTNDLLRGINVMFAPRSK